MLKWHSMPRLFSWWEAVKHSCSAPMLPAILCLSMSYASLCSAASGFSAILFVLVLLRLLQPWVACVSTVEPLLSFSSFRSNVTSLVHLEFFHGPEDQPTVLLVETLLSHCPYQTVLSPLCVLLCGPWTGCAEGLFWVFSPISLASGLVFIQCHSVLFTTALWYFFEIFFLIQR